MILDRSSPPDGRRAAPAPASPRHEITSTHTRESANHALPHSPTSGGYAPSRAPTVTTATTTHTSARSSFSLGSGAPSPARITQEDIAYARLGGGGYPNGGTAGGMKPLGGGANGVNASDSTASLLALQREQTLLAAATDGLVGGGAYQRSGGMGAAVGADPFVARKGPSGPRRAGEGVEEEDQAVVAMEWLPGGGLQLCVTLLAAGFVIGSSGASVREITQHTGAVIQSWTQQPQPGGYHRPTRIFRLQGPRKSVASASEIIHQAVERYKELCEGKRRGEFVQRAQRIRGVEFSYQPPPRSAAPQAAALGGVKGAGGIVAASAHGYPEPAMGAAGGSTASVKPSVNPVNPVAAAAALLGQVPGHLHPTTALAGGVHQYTDAEYGYQTMQMPGAMGAGGVGAAGMGGGIDLGGFSLPAGTDPEIIAAAAAAAAAAAQKKQQLLFLQQRQQQQQQQQHQQQQQQVGGGTGSSMTIPAPRTSARKLSAAAPGFVANGNGGGISFGTGAASFDLGRGFDRLSLDGGGGADRGYFPPR